MRTVLPLKPSVIAATCLCLGLRRAARAVSRRFDEGLRPLNLNNGQFSMLTVIAGLQPVGMQALAEHLAMDRTTVTAGLKPLQRRGLIEVEVSESDSRSREARLTTIGKALLAKAMPLWQGVQEEVGAALPASDATRLHRHLVALS
jgi:DNA-binding MarR family transcriptional regulator